MFEVFSVKEFIKAEVINRPSKIIKSPYLADIKINNRDALAHSPSLGCKGLIKKGTTVLVSEKDNKNIKSKYSIDLIVSDNTTIGVNPIYSNYMVYKAISSNLVKELSNLEEIKKEVKKGNSRFDLVGKKDDKIFYIEVKNVPLIDEKGIAIFPDGFRKRKADTVSPRAVKHLEELITIKEKEPNSECFIIFTIQRSDCKYFKPTDTDILYKNTLLKAKDKGVIIKAYQIIWKDNKAFWDKELIVML